MVEFTFDVDRGTVKEAENEVQALLEEIAVRLSNEMKQEAPVDTGQLRQSISIVDRSKDVITVGVQVDYALDVQQGTEAHTPDLTAMKKWGRRKLGSEGAGIRVRNHIMEEGTEPNPFMTRAIKEVEKRYS